MTKTKKLLIFFLILLSFFSFAEIAFGGGSVGPIGDPEWDYRPQTTGWLANTYQRVSSWLTDGLSFRAIGWWILVIVFNAVAVISLLLARFSVALLMWVLSPSFNQLSYTNPAGNPVIEQGLNITQGFVNIFLILILVYIALATILRVAGYETKKLLVTFVLVALLVNFAPVICGLVVDASNIIMYYFIVNLDQFLNWTDEINDVWREIVGSEAWREPEKMATAFFLAITLAAFGSGIFFIVFIYAVVFIFRYVAIWILVILSPLAFLAYILPATRGIFTKWWRQLIQWSFFGAIAGFFLYLSSMLIVGMFDPTNPVFIVPSAGENGDEMNYIFPLLPSLVPIIFLYIGLIVSFQTSALGAGTIINATRRSGRWARKKGWQSTKWTAKKTGEALKVPEAAIRTSETLGRSRAGRLVAPSIAAWGKKQIDERDKRIKSLDVVSQSRAKGQSVQETVGKYSNKEFAQQVKERDIRRAGGDIIIGANLEQIKAFGRGGSSSAKQAMRNADKSGVRRELRRLRQISNDPNRSLAEQGRATNQANEIKLKLKHIATDPNFQPRV